MSPKPPLPVDRGWAWWVMVGVFLNMYIVISWIRSLSILLPIFLEKYQQSTAVTTLAFGISELFESLSHVVLSLFLVNRFTVRSVTLLGSVANAAAILFLYFSSDIVSLNIVFAILGFARGFMINPPVYLLGAYFKKRLSFASSCGNIGTSVATLSAPLLTQLLLTSFGLEGTFLMSSGIAMHAIISSLLFRPTSLYAVNETLSRNNVSKVNVSDTEDLESVLLSSSSSSSSSLSASPSIPTGLIRSNPSVNGDTKDQQLSQHNAQALNSTFTTGNHNITETKMGTKATPDKDEQNENNSNLYHQQVTSSASQQIVFNNNAVRYAESEELAIQNPHKRNVSSTLSTSTHDTNEEDSESEQRTAHQIPSNKHNHNILAGEGTETETLLQEKSHSEEDAALRERLRVRPKQTDSKLSTNGVTENTSEKDTGPGTTDEEDSQKPYTVTMLEVLRNPTAVLIMIAVIVGVQTQCGNVYMPVLGLENGLTSQQLPWLMTIGGSSDIMGKIVFGFVADRRWLQPINIVCICLINAGVVLQLVSYFQGMTAMAILSIIFGLHAGMVQALVAPIAVQYVGLPSLPHIVSGTFLGNCMLTFGTHLAVGALRDITGSFKWGFRFIGLLMLTAASFLIVVKWRSGRIIDINCRRPKR